jgi:hypothetical protein
MCNDWWTRRETRREKRFDEELRYVLDERDYPEPAAPVASYERDEDPPDPERLAVEAGARS